VSHTRQTLCGDGDTRTYTRRNVIALHYPVYKNSHTTRQSHSGGKRRCEKGGGGHAEARVRPEPGNGTSSDSHAKKLHSQSITRTHTHSVGGGYRSRADVAAGTALQYIPDPTAAAAVRVKPYERLDHAQNTTDPRLNETRTLPLLHAANRRVFGIQ